MDENDWMSAEDLAELLRESGSRFVTAELIRKDIEAGCLANDEGEVRLKDYVAWLINKEKNNGKGKVNKLGASSKAGA